MALTKTVHPPAGATALLAVVDREMLEMGWLLIPVVLLSCLLMLCIALILNNIERSFQSAGGRQRAERARGAYSYEGPLAKQWKTEKEPPKEELAVRENMARAARPLM